MLILHGLEHEKIITSSLFYISFLKILIFNSRKNSTKVPMGAIRRTEKKWLVLAKVKHEISN